MRAGLVPGYNVDELCIKSGIEELEKCGYPLGGPTEFVITYALQCWARGEEERAQRGAIDKDFHGISLTCWYRILAAAKAGALS